MTLFTLISSLFLLGLTFLCYWLPSRNGQKEIGLIISIPIGLIVGLTIIVRLDYLVIFIWPIILAFQIIFLTYWTFRNFRQRKLGAIFSIVISALLLLLALQPWITDWTFSKQDAKEMLSWHKIELNDDFEIVRNESGGFTDYVHIFKHCCPIKIEITQIAA